MPNDQQEVNIVDEIKLEPSPDVEGDEIITPPEPSTEEPTKAEPEVVPVVDSNEPKPVPGETPKERGLRRQVQILRSKLRQERSSELLGDVGMVQAPAPISPIAVAPDNDPLAKYNPDDVKNLEEVWDVLAKKKGYVRQSDIQQQNYTQSASGLLQEFLGQHPEYDKENDPDDVLWGQFKEEFGQFKQPNNPADLKKLFNRVHTSIMGISSTDELSKVGAQQAKLRSASHAGGTGSTPQSRTPQGGGKIDPTLKPYLKGDFSDLDL